MRSEWKRWSLSPEGRGLPEPWWLRSGKEKLEKGEQREQRGQKRDLKVCVWECMLRGVGGPSNGQQVLN